MKPDSYLKQRSRLCVCLCLLFCLLDPAQAERVKFLIMGDTQKIMDAKNKKQHEFLETMEKLVKDPVTRNADFVLQVGDIVESDKDNSDRPEQYAVAQAGWRKLDGKIPYVLNVGNNDHADEYLAKFPLSHYSAWPSFVDHYDDHKNVAHHFKAGGEDWLILSLRFGADAGVLDWAERLIQKHADKNVILINHEMNNAVKTMGKKYPNVVFFLCGHTRTNRELMAGNDGHKIGWIKTCWHNAELDSFFCVVEVDTTAGSVTCRYYSPLYGEYGDDPSSALYGSDKNPMKYAPEKGPFNHPWTWTGFDFSR